MMTYAVSSAKQFKMIDLHERNLLFCNLDTKQAVAVENILPQFGTTNFT